MLYTHVYLPKEITHTGLRQALFVIFKLLRKQKSKPHLLPTKSWDTNLSALNYSWDILGHSYSYSAWPPTENGKTKWRMLTDLKYEFNHNSLFK